MTDHLTCAAALDLVEPIAAGDLEVDDAARAHFETCPRCASALASARRIEAALARETPPAPPDFTAAVLAAVRRNRWRAEQRIDRVFNVAIAAAILAVVTGVAALLNVSEVISAAGAVWKLAQTATNGREVARTSLVTYAGAAAFMASAVAMWWWAERRLSL